MNAQTVYYLRQAAARYTLAASQTEDPAAHRELTYAATLCAAVARHNDTDTVAGGVIGGITGRLGGLR